MILINHPFNLYMVKWGMEIRLVCCSMIYRKVSNATPMDLLSLLRLLSDFRFYACQKQMFSMVSMARCWIWCQLMSRCSISRCSSQMRYGRDRWKWLFSVTWSTERLVCVVGSALDLLQHSFRFRVSGVRISRWKWMSRIFISVWIGKMAAKYRLQTTQCSDKRVKVMKEILHGIQLIKMYTWELAYCRVIDKIRKSVTVSAGFFRCYLF